MTFTELMALDKKPDQTKPVAGQPLPDSTIAKDKTERPVRPARTERSTGSEGSARTERPVRDDYRYIPSEQPYKREIKRHAFEIYKDQIERLQELKVATMKTGQLRSMSDMVREALDDFIKKQA
jgi:hypothetical protein